MKSEDLRKRVFKEFAERSELDFELSKSILPLWAPLYGATPHSVERPTDFYRILGVFFEADEEDIKPFLPAPLELASNIICVEICKYRGISLVNPNPPPELLPDVIGEGKIVIPAKYKGITGGYCMAVYLDDVPSICKDRERMGLPSKQFDRAELFGERVDKVVEGFVYRLGVRIIDINCRLTEEGIKIDIPSYYPRLQLKIIPRADGPGADVKKVVTWYSAGEPTANHKLRPEMRKWYERYPTIEKSGTEATVTFGRSEADPLYKLRPRKIIGGIFSVGGGPYGVATAIYLDEENLP